MEDSDRVAAEHEDTARGDDADPTVGVYVHLPYCERICPYCDFAVLPARRLSAGQQDRYVEALLSEFAARRPAFAGRRLETVYFGGGTPSLFAPEAIGRLVEAIDAAFGGGSRIETTLEVNPSTLERARLPAFREAGIDRLSIGIQSFDDTMLRRLGRAHRASEAHGTWAAARAAGFASCSLDLIFAGPGQDAAALDRDLDAVIQASPDHVSTYELTWEPRTPFGRALEAGRLEACDEALGAAMIEQVERRLTAAGYERYEISSYARPGQRARHNARYWSRRPVLGLGLGAHSMDPPAPGRPHGGRRANPRSLDAWLAAAASGGGGEEEVLSPATARGEAVFLGLRRREGVSTGRFAAEFGGPPQAFFSQEIARCVARGWLEEVGAVSGDLRLTRAGRLFADSVAAEFVEGPPPASAREASEN